MQLEDLEFGMDAEKQLKSKQQKQVYNIYGRCYKHYVLPQAAFLLVRQVE